MHLLKRQQLLPISLNEAWSFFSDPKNLARITPPDMGFVIRAPFRDIPMHVGQRVLYTVKPLFRIPLRWETLITEVDAPHRFVDTQRKGPYKRWEHEHVFSSTECGTLMKDHLVYELPFGSIGELVHLGFVRKRLELIFDHRHDALVRIFGAV